MAPDSGQLNE